jgi:hypothetical protein
MRLFGYLWASPVTSFGLLLAVLAMATGGKAQVRDGVVEVWGGLVGWLLHGSNLRHGGAAATLGHVILARDEDCLARSRAHERFHVRQYERWGPLLPPAYWLVALWLRCRGYHPYLDHPWEPPPQ